jgi:hypothetical protein
MDGDIDRVHMVSAFTSLRRQTRLDKRRIEVHIPPLNEWLLFTPKRRATNVWDPRSVCFDEAIAVDHACFRP